MRLEELLDEHMGSGATTDPALEMAGRGTVSLMEWGLDAGFQTDHLLVLTETDIFGQPVTSACPPWPW